MSKIVSDGAIQWLLGADNPPVRYLTLVHVLGRGPESSEVRDAESRLMRIARGQVFIFGVLG
jgi:hypothetical protein